jgi:hypothetical protein
VVISMVEDIVVWVWIVAIRGGCIGLELEAV